MENIPLPILQALAAFVIMVIWMVVIVRQTVKEYQKSDSLDDGQEKKFKDVP